MTHPQHAIILLAGIGSRLKPITDTMHKALIPIQGRTILERQLEQLNCSGITSFHLVLGYRADDIQNFVKKKFPDLHVTFYPNENFAKTNTAYSLNLVLKTFAEPFLLLDGDVLLSESLTRALCRDTTENLLLCETDPAKLDAEAVKVRAGASGTITEIGKQVALKEAHGESLGVGLYQKDWALALRAYLEHALQHEKNWNWYYEDAMQRMLAHDTAPSPLKILSTGNAVWVEVDDHADLARARSITW